MKNVQMKKITDGWLLLRPVIRLIAPSVEVLLCAAAWPSLAEPGDDRRAPDLPSPACDALQVPAGNRLTVHLYALGVQITAGTARPGRSSRPRPSYSPTPATTSKWGPITPGRRGRAVAAARSSARVWQAARRIEGPFPGCCWGDFN